jgi:hypothetical protein
MVSQLERMKETSRSVELRTLAPFIPKLGAPLESVLCDRAHARRFSPNRIYLLSVSDNFHPQKSMADGHLVCTQF